MSCFWIGLRQALRDADYALVGKARPTSVHALVKLLRDIAEPPTSVQWMGKPLSKADLQDYAQHSMPEWDTSLVGSYHITGSCDPYLCTIAHTMRLNINLHVSNPIVFKGGKRRVDKALVTFRVDDARGLLEFSARGTVMNGHFAFMRRTNSDGSSNNAPPRTRSRSARPRKPASHRLPSYAAKAKSLRMV